MINTPPVDLLFPNSQTRRSLEIYNFSLRALKSCGGISSSKSFFLHQTLTCATGSVIVIDCVILTRKFSSNLRKEVQPFQRTYDLVGKAVQPNQPKILVPNITRRKFYFITNLWSPNHLTTRQGPLVDFFVKRVVQAHPETADIPSTGVAQLIIFVTWEVT